MRSRTAFVVSAVALTFAVAWALAGPAFAAQAAQAVGAPAAAPASAPTAAEPVKAVERTVAAGGVIVARLENGLTVIVKPTRTAPVVCVRAFVHAGGLYEKEFLGCGLSHLCEHLVAKGEVTDEGPASKGGETRSVVSDIGGQSNASTSMEFTQYYISAAAGKAMDCIDLIADWMARAKIEDKDFQREHGVVQRELELGKDAPGRAMWDTHSADVYGSHPAAVPVIGFANPLSKVTLQDVQTYHDRMYVPENMVFVVVGDVDGEAALTRVCRAFAGFRRGRVPDLSLPDVRPLPGVIRTVRPHADLKDVMEEISFQSITLFSPDLHALDVLSTILSSGESSRLEAKVRRELKLVTSIDSSSWTPEWGTGIFNISFRSEAGKADEAEKAIFEQLREVADKGVTDAELARAKREMIAEFVHQQQSVESISSQLGHDYLMTGDVNFSRAYTKRIDAVTAEQVRQAARKYVTFDRMAVTRLVPQGEATTGPATAAAGKSSAVTFTMPNGLKVVLSATDAVELVSMALVARGGLLLETPAIKISGGMTLETPGTNGMGTLMAALSTKGAGSLSAEQISDFFAAAGGSISASCGNNSTFWQATVLDDSFIRAVEIFADVVVRPTFPEKELDILRPMQLAAIQRVSENWQPELQKFFREKFFAATNSPYAMLPTGSKDVVQAATVKQIADWHRKTVLAGDSVLAIYGHFDPAAAEKLVRKAFADLPGGKVEVKLPAAPTVPAAGERQVLKTKKANVAAVMVAVPGMTVDNLQDRFPIDVLDTIISGWELPDGWLHAELRGKQLVYVVHAYNWPGLAPGAFLVLAAGQPDKTPEVLSIIDKNLRKAAGYTPTKEEIARAVNTILTAELLDKQSMNSLAMSAALDELYGFGYDFRAKLEGHYTKVTPADVARVAKKYFSGGYATYVTTPTPEILDAAKGTGAATTKPAVKDEDK
jgi:zinc protease